jgi:8-amino-7-oxononanoate synthase
MWDLATALAERRAQSNYRSRRLLGSPQGPEVVLDGEKRLSFCSNDYLGLANHPEIATAFRAGVDRYGSGAGAAHLITGHSVAHQALEEELAAFTGRARALLFSTGYMANLGAFGALLGRGDLALEDRLNHASLIDAGLLSGARFQRYPHGDIEAAQNRLRKTPDGRRLVITDGIFSMDGDIAPLTALSALCQQEGAWLMVDDAHGFGVLGETGGGCCEALGLGVDEVPVLVGTLGKGFGTAGAFVAGSDDLIETLIQQARPYIYTTAMPAAVAEATRASLRLVQSETWRREHLRALVVQLRAGLAQFGIETGSDTPIQPIVVGDSTRAMTAAEALRRLGIEVTAIRPPTVPEGSARLRITLSAAHSETHVTRLLDALATLDLKKN